MVLPIVLSVGFCTSLSANETIEIADLHYLEGAHQQVLNSICSGDFDRLSGIEQVQVAQELDREVFGDDHIGRTRNEGIRQALDNPAMIDHPIVDRLYKHQARGIIKLVIKAIKLERGDFLGVKQGHPVGVDPCRGGFGDPVYPGQVGPDDIPGPLPGSPPSGPADPFGYVACEWEFRQCQDDSRKEERRCQSEASRVRQLRLDYCNGENQRCLDDPDRPNSECTAAINVCIRDTEVWYFGRSADCESWGWTREKACWGPLGWCLIWGPSEGKKRPSPQPTQPID